MEFDSDVLRTFVTVHETGTTAAAARALFVSQPALSARIRRLERAVGADLFVREPHGMTLTAAGRAFLPHARAALGSLREGALAVAATTGDLPLRIAVVDDSLAVPARAIDALSDAVPSIEVVRLAEPAQADALRSHAVDLALAGRLDQGRGLRRVELVREALALAVPASAGIAEPVDLAAVDLPHYLPRDDFAPSWVARVRELIGPAPTIAPLRADSTAAPMRLVESGRGVAVSLASTPVPAGVAMLALRGDPAYEWFGHVRDQTEARVQAALTVLANRQ
ncbi:LysR family transcriptional regulator [Calidifontibacter sp. DB0510]|uniref:LysR family transcriptional regulator n=1 Tax=Metallococcus carri TaxID=1656884 RepID=A0A967AZH1_9MICO|nr:LysR family transcriptional regulator [Metallococcus carri]NHN54598.1 LysR family transcriptional regulator [Metallococcus carri]NOP36563.1 LysR family transcriptional regulator [Calidifontibacter sp. DB2511S]